MNRVAQLLWCLLFPLMTACATQPPATGPSFVVVRHAEKMTGDPRDPVLTDAGHARAVALAASLADVPLIAIYATAYRRTQQTAAPSARTHGLTVLTYDARQPAADFVARLKRTHHHGTVLVVGHSNTVPDIAAALCVCVVAPMNEAEYDRRLTIRVDADGVATLTQSHD